MKYLLLSGLIIALLATGLWLLLRQAEARVEVILKQQRPESFPILYSTTTQVVGRLPFDQLRDLLLEHGYHKMGDSDIAPGQFYGKNPSVEIYLRGFVQSDGKESPPLRIQIDTNTGAIQDSAGRELPQFTLEPVILANLASAPLQARHFIALAQIPIALQQAALSAEDQRFYRHYGLDPLAIARAAGINLRRGRIAQGGSTITQQLAKNLFLGPEQTWSRKFNEVLATLILEAKFSKPQILEKYLNEIYLGQFGYTAFHGVGEAATFFFNKDVSQLTLAESALLMGLIKAPSQFSPRRHPDRALQRRDAILTRMHELDFISHDQLHEALSAPLNINLPHYASTLPPQFIRRIRSELSDILPNRPNRGGRLVVQSSINPQMQRCADRVLEVGLEELTLKQRSGATQSLEGALIALDHRSGAIRAWVGGRPSRNSYFDRAYQSRRQLGSAVKPFLYLSTLDTELNTYKVAAPTSTFMDLPLSVPLSDGSSWSPVNYNREFRGLVTLRVALERSLNLPAVRAGLKIGPKTLAHNLKQFGFSGKIAAVPALALGTLDTSLYEATRAYSVLASGGIFRSPSFLEAIQVGGARLPFARPADTRIANEAAVFVLTDMLRGVVNNGTGSVIRRMGIKYDVAGKTGTSSQERDSWFIGYAPNLTVGVWVGSDDNTKIGLTGASGAAPIWARFLECIEPFYELGDSFTIPPGVVSLPIHRRTGHVAKGFCGEGQIVQEVFVRGTEPIQTCPSYVDSVQVASTDRPPTQQQGEVFSYHKLSDTAKAGMKAGSLTPRSITVVDRNR